MKRITKRWILSALAVGTLCASAFSVACGKKTGPQFLKGIQTDIELGDSIVMEHFFQYVNDSDYSIIITGPNGYYLDATNKSYWSPTIPGTYKFTYTVKKGEYKGVNSFDLEVTVPELAIEYTMNNVVYDTGDVLVFEEYFSDMNIAAKSFYSWQMVMDSVTVGNQTHTFSEEDTEYMFSISGPHTFISHIQSEDGQSITLKQSINVRHVDVETFAWMNKNNIDAHNALRLDPDNQIVLDESVYSYKDCPSVPWGSTEKQMASYVAFEGEYSFNDFVVFDFTGNNMPAITFFNDEINDNPFYSPNAKPEQNKGLLFANGWTTGLGKPYSPWENSINNCFCAQGPNKTSKVDWDLDGWFRSSITGGSGVGMTNLTREENINCSYRMAIGITAGDENGATVAVYCINMTTGQVMLETTERFETTETSTFPEGYFTGSIVLYGMYGKTTTLDRIYAIEEDTTITALKEKYFVKSQFAAGAKTVVRIGETLNADEYITPAADANYTFGYFNEANEYTAIENETFAFAQSGLYKLMYSDGEHLPSQITIEVISVDDATVEFFNENNISFYNLVSAKENKVVLKPATHDGDSAAPGYGMGITSNMPYVAFNGAYGMNDYLVFDFTGNNFPFISFFNNQVTSTVFNNKILLDQKGVVIGAGMYTPDGSIYNDGGALSRRLTAYGPNKCAWYDDTKAGQFREDIDDNSPLALYNIKYCKASYRVIIGFNGTGRNAHGNYLSLQMFVFDLNSGATIFEAVNQELLYFDTCTSADFVGSIALHGQFSKTTTIDKLYAIEENTTMAALKEKYASISAFNSAVETEVYTNTAFNVLDYIQPQGAAYQFWYIDEHGKETQITGDTFSFTTAGEYTLHFIDAGKLPASITLTVEPRPSEFQPLAKTMVEAGEVLNVTDYIITFQDAVYTLKYSDAAGNESQITGATFSFALPGTYTLYYMDGVNTEVSKTITVVAVKSKFQATANGSVCVGQTLTVSDYIVKVAGAQYTLSYRDKAGVTTPITGASFSFAQVGVYTLIYNDGVNMESTFAISVADVSSAAAEWIRQNNISYYNVQSIDDNQKVVLGASTIEGSANPNESHTARDMSYLAFNNTYGAGDYLVIEFTGSNMPYITFAAGSVTNDAWNVVYNEDGSRGVADLTDSGKGITVSNGYRRTDGSMCGCSVEKRLNFTGPFKMQSAEGDIENQAMRTGVAQSNGLGLHELVDGHKYRLMIGMHSISGTTVRFGVCLLDLTAGTQIYFTNDGIVLDAGSADLSNVNGNLFEGSIILHGQFGQETTLDKVYSIYEDRVNVDEVKWSF